MRKRLRRWWAGALRPVLATWFLAGLVAWNVTVIFANTVQVIGFDNLVVVRRVRKMRTIKLGFMWITPGG